MKIHYTRLGKATPRGGDFDLDGFLHTTAREWAVAPVDTAGERWPYRERYAWAVHQAAESRRLLRESGRQL